MSKILPHIKTPLGNNCWDPGEPPKTQISHNTYTKWGENCINRNPEKSRKKSNQNFIIENPSHIQILSGGDYLDPRERPRPKITRIPRDLAQLMWFFRFARAIFFFRKSFSGFKWFWATQPPTSTSKVKFTSGAIGPSANFWWVLVISGVSGILGEIRENSPSFRRFTELI